MTANRPVAVVFYARDFLSVEFPAMGRTLQGYKRVYIVVSAAEKANVVARDPDGTVFRLGDWPCTTATHLSAEVACAYNNDRYLRSYDTREIQFIVGAIDSLCSAVLAQFDVRFFLDEPVSGFPNLMLNRRLTAAGAVCLHFQTSWLPNHMFFSSDPAQAVLPRLELLNGSIERVHRHIEERLANRAMPLYVLNYNSAISRMKDAGVTLAKAAYRNFYRAGEYYLDRDPSAHLTHCSALLASLRGGYASRTQLESLGGKYVLYPLHYEPEAILNYFSGYSRQEEIAEQILDVLPMGYELILKEHPSQPGALNLRTWQRVTKYRRVIKVRGNVNARSLLRFDIVVVSIGSTLAIEAALAGRPVGVLGDVHFAGMPGIRVLQSPRDLSDVLEMPKATRKQIEEWYGAFMDAHCFEGTIMKGRTTEIALSQILTQLTRRRAM